MLNETEEGRQYLRDVKRLNTKRMDREGLRRLMEKLGPATH